MITECQVKIAGQWETVDLATAVAKHLQDMKRCPECWGRVSQYRLEGVKLHFGHVEAHPGCPRTRHPNAIE
jgi:hypothetical protein